MMKAIHWLVSGASKGDALFFHYSGHGGQMRDADCTEDDGFDETLIPCDYTSCGQIPDDTLWKELVNKVPEGVRLTAIMDCCHSGTGLDLPFKFQMGRGWTVDDDPGFSPGDVQMFSGCRDDQTSADCVAGGVAGGAMTNAFLAVLSAHDDGDLQYHELMESLHAELKRKRMSQKPQLSSSQKFELADRAFSLSDGVLGNANAHLGRPPRQPGFKKRPNTAGAAPMGGLDIESFLAAMNGAEGSDDLVPAQFSVPICITSIEPTLWIFQNAGYRLCFCHTLSCLWACSGGARACNELLCSIKPVELGSNSLTLAVHEDCNLALIKRLERKRTLCMLLSET